MHQSTRPPPRRAGAQSLKWLGAAALIALTALVYYPGLSGPFIFDDFTNIVEKPAVQMETLGWESITEAATAYGERLPHRPVATISLALDYWLWGDEPFGFKVTNLLVHLATFILIFLLARQLFQLAARSEGKRDGFWPALIVAGLWALHPLQVSTVLYVVQRMEMLAALFIVLSLLAYIAGRKRLRTGAPGGWWLLVGAGAGSLLAVLSKETGALAPFFMLALEALLFRFETARPASARVLKLGFALVLAAALAGWLFWLLPAALSPDAYVHRDFSLAERLLTQLRALPMYLGWMLWPATDHYLFYYDHYAPSAGLLRPVTTLLGGLLLTALLVTSAALRRRAPLVALGIIWFFIAHALTSNVVALELVFEHRNYFALFAVLLAVVAALRALMLALPSSSAGRLARVAPLVLVAGLSVLTLIRAATWGDAMNLAIHQAYVNPDSPRAGQDLAEVYLDWADGQATSPFMSMARIQLEKTARLPGATATADVGLIVMAARYGEIIDFEADEDGKARSREETTAEAAWRRLLAKMHAQRALQRGDMAALYNLSQQRYEGLAIDDARMWQLHQVLCRRSDLPAVLHVRFGYYAAQVLDDAAGATSAFRRALALLADKPEEQKALQEAIAAAGIELAPGIRACEPIDGELEGAFESASPAAR